MTNEELERAVERLHELAKAASDGPWTYERCIRSGFEVWGRYAASVVSSDELARHGAISREDDAAFIAAANPSTILALLSERAELLATVERMRDCLLGIALSDRYRRYPKQHEDGGVRGQSGLRAIRALTGQHGSHLNDEDVVRLDKAARADLTTGEEK